MRILFFTDHFYPEVSAPAAHIYERARIWKDGGHEVTVVASAPNFPVGRVFDGYKNSLRVVEDVHGIRVIRVKTYIAENKGTGRRILDFVSYAPSALANSLTEPAPDVVISSSPHLFVPVAAIAFAKIKRVPHVFEIRDLWPAFLGATTNLGHGRIYRMLERMELTMYRHSERIIAFTSSFIRDLVSRDIPREKLDLVIVGANLSLFKPRVRDEELKMSLGLSGKFVLGYLGTHGLAHGLHNIVRAAELLQNRDVAFVFVGEGADKESIMSLATEKALTNVVFVPRQPKEEMPRYWSICDASLVHLKNDPLFETVIPSKLFESMAMGLPIVYAGPNGEASSIIRDTDAGVCLSSDDPEGLAAAAIRLATDSEDYLKLKDNSRSAAPRFSRERQAAATLTSLERAVESYSGRNTKLDP